MPDRDMEMSPYNSLQCKAGQLLIEKDDFVTTCWMVLKVECP